MTYDCGSVLKLVLTCYDIVSHVVGLSYVVSLSYETKKTYRVNRPLGTGPRRLHLSMEEMENPSRMKGLSKTV